LLLLFSPLFSFPKKRARKKIIHFEFRGTVMCLCVSSKRHFHELGRGGELMTVRVEFNLSTAGWKILREGPTHNNVAGAPDDDGLPKSRPASDSHYPVDCLPNFFRRTYHRVASRVAKTFRRVFFQLYQESLLKSLAEHNLFPLAMRLFAVAFSEMSRTIGKFKQSRPTRIRR
jgi:hypothetical protein